MEIPDDVDSLKKLVRELGERLSRAEANDRFRLVVETAPYGVIVSNREGGIVMVNRQALTLFGYSEEEFLDLTIDALVPSRLRGGHPSHRAHFHEKPSARAMGAGRDLFAVRKDGHEFPVEIALTPFSEEDDGLILSSIVDITRRKESEDELLRYSRELERSNAELESFASVASHDLQEPLRKIRTMGERLLRSSGDDLDEKGRDYLDRMVKAGDNMQRLIRDLLTFSRVATRGKPFEPVDLNLPVSEALSMLEIAIEESGAEITVDDLPVIEADEGQMQQLFLNLVGNALKFRKPGASPHISIRLIESKGGETKTHTLSVRDDGIGFDEKYRDRIFSVFQRLHGKGKFEGTGIGLAICKKIVERHGGTIRASSEPGEGSEFFLELSEKQPEQPEVNS